MSDQRPLVVASCGASGQLYTRCLLEIIVEKTDLPVSLIVSSAARDVARSELNGQTVEAELPADRISVFENDQMASPLASGSFATAGMIICPCSVNTLGALAAGISDTLVKRAGQVHLRQRRPLIVGLREMPLSAIDLENMLKLSRAGAVVAPLSPSFYHGPKTIDDLARFTAERLLDLVWDVEMTFRYQGE